MADPIRCPPKDALVVDRENAHCATYLCRSPRAHTLDDVCGPYYFGLMQNRTQQDRLVREGDFIDVQPEDFTWFVRLMVRACAPTVDQVITDIIYQKAFPVGKLPAGWTMEHRGDRGWTISLNNQEKASHFKTPEGARQHIINAFGGKDEVEDTAPRNKGGRPRKGAAEAPEKEPEPA
jgi:hypothetical protein